MNLKKDKIQPVKGLIVVALALVFVYYVTVKLIVGASWSSGLPLGGVDNFLNNGGSLYTVLKDGMTPGSSYFPGIVLLSLLYRILFGYGAETAIVITGAVIGVVTLICFSYIATTDKNERFWLFCCGALFMMVELPSAKAYLLEMHPDIPALMFFALGVIVLNKYIRQDSNITLFLASTVLFYLSGIFKQNAVFLYVGLGIYTLFSKSLAPKKKIKIFLSEFLAGIMVLVTVFLIEGCWYNCITVNSMHPLLGVRSYLDFAIITVKDNIVFLALAFVYLVFLSTRNIRLKNELERMWFASAIAWIIFCMYGAAKDGANSGNMEAAIIAAMPFVFIIIRESVYYITSILNRAKIKADIQNLKNFKLIRSSIIAMCVVVYCTFVISVGYKSITYIGRFHNRLSLQNEFSNWLTENYKGKNVAYDTDVYEILNNAEVNKTTDLCTASVWVMGNIIDDNDLKRMSEDEGWDIIITKTGLDDSKWPHTFSNYYKLDKSNYPNLDECYGDLVIYLKTN